MHAAPVCIRRLLALVLLGLFVQVRAQPAAELSATVAVSGIEDTAGYAAVTAWLESVVSLSALTVEEASADTVIYRVRVQGDLQQLARAIESNGQLQPVPVQGPASLSYRYSP